MPSSTSKNCSSAYKWAPGWIIPLLNICEFMNDQYVLLLESDAFINFIHEKFSVETFDSHSVSGAVDSGNPVVLLAISVVNFNRLPLRTHKHIVLYAWQLTIRFQFFGTVNHFGAWRKNFKYDTRRIQCIFCLVFIAVDRDIGVVIAVYGYLDAHIRGVGC